MSLNAEPNVEREQEKKEHDLLPAPAAIKFNVFGESGENDRKVATNKNKFLCTLYTNEIVLFRTLSISLCYIIDEYKQTHECNVMMYVLFHVQVHFCLHSIFQRKKNTKKNSCTSIV